MSSQLLSPTQSEPTQTGLFSINQKPPGLQSEVRQTTVSQLRRFWMRKTFPVAIALGMLPVFGGVLTLSLGQRMVQDTTSSVAQEVIQSVRSRWSILLVGASVTAVLTGGLAWLWFKVFVHSLVKQSTQLATQSDQAQVSAALQDWGYIIGLLQETESIHDIVEIAGVEVRSLFQSDRVLVLCNGENKTAAISVDEAGAAPVSRLEADFSESAMPLNDLFSVPVGYVQICSEVDGSSLSQSHQDTLRELGVQSQMTTQMTIGQESLGFLVVQCSAPRDWTDVEHQLFAAIAKQIAIAINTKVTVSPNASQPDLEPVSARSIDDAQADYYTFCDRLLQSSHNQAHRLSQVIDRMHAAVNNDQMLSQGLRQIQSRHQSHMPIIEAGETSADRAIVSLHQMEATLAQAQHSSEQLMDLSKTISQISSQINDLANRVNHQAMNASITARKHPDMDQGWSVEFTNDMLQLTRDLSHHAQEIEKFSSSLLAETSTVSTSIDTGTEQLLVSTEWVRNSQQPWTQVVATNSQLETSLQRLLELHQDREQGVTLSYQQVLELSRWLNQTIEESETMVQSIEDLTSRAPA